MMAVQTCWEGGEVIAIMSWLFIVRGANGGNKGAKIDNMGCSGNFWGVLGVLIHIVASRWEVWIQQHRLIEEEDCVKGSNRF